MIRKAVLPVAGLGTRLLPATKAIPKEMLPVFDRPAIQHVVQEAIAAGIEHIVFVTGRNKGAIEDYFDRAYELEDLLRIKGKRELLDQLEQDLPLCGSMSFVRQQSPLGLGHAILCARDVIGDEPFAVLLPDVLVQAKNSCLNQMVHAFAIKGGNIIAVNEVRPEDVSKYGIVDPFDQQGDLFAIRGMVEKPSVSDAPSNLAITGRYILQPEIFDLLEVQEAGAGGEVQLTDAMVRLMSKDTFHALAVEGQIFDCGDKLGYLEASVAYGLADPELSEEARDRVAHLVTSISS